MASSPHMFRRSKTPTACLAVGNAGEAAGLAAPTLLQLLKPSGAFQAHPHTNPAMPVVFVEFASAQQATLAKQGMDNGTLVDLAARSLCVGYAVRCEEERPRRSAAQQPQQTPVHMDAASLSIPGLSLLVDYVTEAEEAALLSCIDAQPWEQAASRRVQHYGRRFSYVQRGVDAMPAAPMPAEIASAADRVSTQDFLQGHAVDQVTVNEYIPGVGFTAHVDTHSAFQGAVLSLTLAGHTVMEFRRPGHTPRALLLPQRSLLIMAGEARLAWFHYIPHRKHDVINGGSMPRPPRRVSLTMRSVRSVDNPCRCAFADQCDSQGGGMPPTRLALIKHDATTQQPSNQTIEQTSHAPIEATYVHTVYDAIAGHFSATRFAVWGSVRDFITSLAAHALVADVGCGNGKYFYVRPDLAVLGSDRSPALAGVATRRLSLAHKPAVADVAVADALHLPYRSGCADAALCIAVLHHLSTPPRRRQLLAELARVLMPGGRALVTVWALEQQDAGLLAKWVPLGGDDATQRDYLVPWHLPMHRADAPAALAVGEGDAVVDPRKHAVVLQRYYHLFASGELEALVGEVPGLRVVCSYYEKSNWGVELERVSPPAKEVEVAARAHAG